MYGMFERSDIVAARSRENIDESAIFVAIMLLSAVC
jgi:hypothetical protein